MKEFKTISADELQNIVGGDWQNKAWSSWGYYLGKKARWNLNHPYMQL